MVSKIVTIKNETGLHTRPGQRFVKQAQSYVCDIVVKKDEKIANAKSLLKMLKLGISQGDEMTIECSGENEEKALAELVQWIENLTE